VPDFSLPWARAFVGTAALAFLAGRAIHDVARHGRDAPRAREYGFLLLTTLAAVVYGVVHDQITATISPEYFLVWKGLAGDPRPLRLAVTLVAVRSSWWVGLLAGAGFLLANNPRRSGVKSLGYRELGGLAALPLENLAEMARRSGRRVEEFYRAADRRARYVQRLLDAESDGDAD
jgi:hypothetical protein